MPERIGTTSGLTLQHAGAGITVVLCAVILAGCASTSPRFRTAEKTASEAQHDEDEVRFASKVKEEETREDDKKVDVQAVKTKFTAPSGPRPASYSNITPPGINRDAILLDVVSFLGVPYAFGGSTKKGIDCSAFTSSVYSTALGKKLPRSTRDQFKVGASVSKSDLQFGDLVFFNTTGRSPSHVGIYIEDDLFVHASISYGVTISSLESTYYRKRFVGARRVVE